MLPPVLAKTLKAGDTIAFVSLSLRLNEVFPDPITRAKAVFEKRGYKVKIFFSQDEGIRSSVDNRLAEFRAAFLDPNISAIVCTIGGGSFTELLPSIMFDNDLRQGIRENPKIVVGLSDMTGLHWFLHARTGLRSFYGPSAIPELGTTDEQNDDTSPLAFCIRNLFKAISNTEPLGDIPRSLTYAPKDPAFFSNPSSTEKQVLSQAPKWQWLRQGRGRGRLFGGCLTIMARLNGIPAIRPDWSNRVVFFETMASDAEDPDVVRTGLADLIAAGVFDEAAGLIIGRPCRYDSEEDRENFSKIITELLCNKSLVRGKNDFPILLNVDIGHTTPMVTLPLDAMVSLDSSTDTFAVLESGVSA